MLLSGRDKLKRLTKNFRRNFFRPTFWTSDLFWPNPTQYSLRDPKIQKNISSDFFSESRFFDGPSRDEDFSTLLGPSDVFGFFDYEVRSQSRSRLSHFLTEKLKKIELYANRSWRHPESLFASSESSGSVRQRLE